MPGRGERTPLAVEPVERRLVHQVPRELVDDQRRTGSEQRRDTVEPVRQIADRMERADGDDGVEIALVILEILQPDPSKGSPWGASGSIPSISYPSTASAVVSSPWPQPTSRTRAGEDGR